MQSTRQEIHIPAGEARTALVATGEVLSIVSVEGKQVGDLVAFNAVDRSEYLSTSHTRNMLWRLHMKLGDQLMSNRRRPMFQVVVDDVGTHDLLCVACDPMRYLLDYGVEAHRNCLDNFLEALAGYDLPCARIPDPINVFQNAPVSADGQMELLESKARPGDRFALRALQDTLVAVSACPQDLAQKNGYRDKDLKLTVEAGS